MAQPESTSRIGVGTIIADTYEIKRLLGRGGMGTVWEASHARLPGKKVAIKVLHPEVAKDTESLARFRREAEIASRIGHPNIVDVHDFNELADGTPYLILEYLEGISLEDRVQQGAMPLEEVVSLTRQIGSALRAAHAEGVIHRDLKPQNIFLARTTDAAGNETYRARVLDFGISKIRGSSTVQTQDSTILGTPQYMAPEQATGAHSSVDQRTDVFALGAMVYEMLAGRPAFDGQTIPEVVFKVVYEPETPLDQLSAAPPAVVRAVHQALAKKQEDRFQTVESFVESLSGTALSMRGAPVPTGVHQNQPQKQTGDAALASTVASGNHPAVPGLAQTGIAPVGVAQTGVAQTGVAQTGVAHSGAMHGGEQQALGVAATIDSGRLAPSDLGLAAPVAQSAIARPGALVETQAVAPKSGSAGLKIALALTTVLGLAGAGVAFWALTRSDEKPASEVAAATSSADADATERLPVDPSLGNGENTTNAGNTTNAANKPGDNPAGDKKDGKDGKTVESGDKKDGKSGKNGKSADGKDGKSGDKKDGKNGKSGDKKDGKNGKDRDGTKDLGTKTVTVTKAKDDDGDGNAPVDDPEKDYQEARALLHSNPRRAIKLVQRALSNGKKSTRYYVVKAYAHCKLRDLTRLNATLAKIRSKSRRESVKAKCKTYWPDYDG